MSQGGKDEGGKAAGKQYALDVEALGKGHGLGPPHLSVAVATLEAIFEKSKEMSGTA